MLAFYTVLLAAAVAFATPDYSFTPPVGWTQVKGRPVFTNGQSAIGVAPVQLKGCKNVAKAYLTNPELKAIASRTGLLGGRPSEEFEVIKDDQKFSAGCAVDFGETCLMFFLEYTGGPKPPADVLAKFNAAKATFRLSAVVRKKQP